MKKVAMIVCAATLALTGCPETGEVGDKGLLKVTPPPSESPTPTKSAKPTPKVSKKPDDKPPKSDYKPKKYYIEIQNVNDQYQPNERHVLQGDILIFTNKDPNNDHTLTEGAQRKDDPVFDSGKVTRGGDTHKFVVDWEPGEYMYHCELVPYMQTAGPIKVSDNPQV